MFALNVFEKAKTHTKSLFGMSVTSCCTACLVLFYALFMNGPFCQGSLKLGLSTLFTTFFSLNISLINISSIAPMDWSTTLAVPSNCTSGTFRWDYPSGHVTLNFPLQTRVVKVCFSEGMGGDYLTLTDKTSNIQLAQLDWDNSAYNKTFFIY